MDVRRRAQRPRQSRKLRRVSDYCNVEITDAINPSTCVYRQCFNADGSSNPTLQKAANPFCSLITRNDHAGSGTKAPYFNRVAATAAST